METDYTNLKRATLKELLEARGIIASNKTKATLIVELMEGDRAAAAAPLTDSTQNEFGRELQCRLAHFPGTPPTETLERIMSDVHEYIMGKQRADWRSREGSLITPHIVPGKPKLPYHAFKNYVETEDIDGYLHDFERLCQLHEINAADQVTLLVSKLAGRAAEAYRTMPDEDSRDYQKVKQAILDRYAITPEAYRQRFRESRKTEKDTHMEWAHRLTRAGKGWVQAAQATTVEDMLQLLLLEQFFQGLTPDLQNWLRDRKPRILTEAARWADEYQDARRAQQAQARSILGAANRPPTINPTPALRPGGGNYQTPPRYNNARSFIRCHTCNQQGHMQRDCPRNRNRSTWNTPTNSPANRAAVHCYQSEPRQPFFGTQSNEESLGTLHEVNPVQAAADNRQGHRQGVHVEGKRLQGLRDSGATITLVRNHLVPKHQLTGEYVAVRVAGGAIYKIPTAKVHLDWGAGSGNVEVGLMQDLPADVILGNDLGELTSAFVSPHPAQEALPVVTRQQARTTASSEHSEAPVSNSTDPPFIPWAPPLEFGTEVVTDPSLQVYRDRVTQNQAGLEGERYAWEKGLLYRYAEKVVAGSVPVTLTQLVVPRKYRQELLRIAHDIPLSGHLGVSRTKHRLTQNFFWPGVSKDIRQYCQTCDTCQRVGKRGDRYKAKMHSLPIIDEPFSRVAVDIIGPLAKPSPSGKKYILTVVDYATRYPEAVALTNIHAETIVDALIRIFSRMGFPKEIISDRGTQFTAEVTHQLWRTCGVKPIVNSAYHPQSNGLCERFNGTLKQMLRTFMDTQKDWERFLPHLLFAYREVPQESTGFSPFELLFGRRVRGPLDLIREHWEGTVTSNGTPIVPYVLEFRERLETLIQTVRSNLQAAQQRQRRWYDRGARDRSFQIGQKVLILKPVQNDKLQASWQGPYKVVEQVCDTTYIIAPCTGAGGRRMLHVNMLKPYHERTEEVTAICASAAEDPNNLPLPDLLAQGGANTELGEVQLGDRLSTRERAQILELIREKGDTFSNQPGYTPLATHRVETPGQHPLRQTPYRIPESVKDHMRKEIDEMLQLGVIEHSDSPWASPVVLVPKRDGTTRFCVDYRKLNDKTISDAYPMPRIDELLDKMARGQYLTTIDLCKGYWQIPLAEDAIPKSAFVTPFGLYQFKVMPFGMKNAPATFQRMVDRLLDGSQEYACAYLDDIAIFSNSWDEHLTHIGAILDRIREAGLTLKPSKCHVGMAEVQYLGHRVGSGRQKPEPAKIEAVAKWPTPRTKTQVLAFLGTAGYYRKFVPDYSALAKPLTDLTKKNLPKVVTWSPECEKAFQELKSALIHAPVLAAPDPTKRFLVHTDASMFGLGAVLSQVGADGGEHPVAYLSRKLQPREVSYAAIEKECLAVVWALKKLQPYLYGQQFALLTDHNPLVWLNRVSGDNARLLRWSLALQPFDFTIQYRPGKQNGNADGLSRQTELEK